MVHHIVIMWHMHLPMRFSLPHSITSIGGMLHNNNPFHHGLCLPFPTLMSSQGPARLGSQSHRLLRQSLSPPTRQRRVGSPEHFVAWPE